MRRKRIHRGSLRTVYPEGIAIFYDQIRTKIGSCDVETTPCNGARYSNGRSLELIEVVDVRLYEGIHSRRSLSETCGVSFQVLSLLGFDQCS